MHIHVRILNDSYISCNIRHYYSCETTKVRILVLLWLRLDTQCTCLALDVIVSSQLMTGTFADVKMLTKYQVAYTSFFVEILPNFMHFTIL